jgi:hypothetical protein
MAQVILRPRWRPIYHFVRAYNDDKRIKERGGIVGKQLVSRRKYREELRKYFGIERQYNQNFDLSYLSSKLYMGTVTGRRAGKTRAIQQMRRK